MSSNTKATATNEEATPALVPKLRFPEFREAEGWEYEPLGKLLMKSPDYGVNAAAAPFNELLPKYLRITDISDEGTYLSGKKVSVDLEPTDEIYLDEGDIVLARTGASVGKSYRYRKEDGRLVFAGFLIRVKPNRKRLVSTYLSNFLTTEQYWKWVAATSARSGQPGINSAEYSSLAIPLPAEFAEQQKIADCLSSVDELIAAQARKLDALKTHKKGLMQQLFPREGETQPRLRFPEFQNAGEWVVKAIGDVFKVTRGEVLSMTLVKDEESSDAPYPVYSSQTKRNGLAGYFAEYLYQDAITWTTDGANAGDVNFRPGKFYCTNVCGVLLNTDGQANPCIAALLNSVSRGHVSYVGNPKLMNGVMAKIEIPFPPLEEQQRIAECLTSLDDLIAAQTQKHEALKTHKKGLMQQLFPSPEEVA
jgi:type I restriction enzyme S subunit